jgi:cardiolipin synthase
LERLTHAGIAVRRFPSRPARARTNVFYRLHRKIAVLDHHVAFVGSIDICSRHLRSAGVESMQDYAVRVSGPVVKDILECTRSRAEPRDLPSWQRWRDRIGAVPNVFRLPELDGQVLFVARNDRSRATDIETMYRMGIHNAKRQIVIANGCFCPGYRLLRDLARAARRGVDVKLILQGRRDIATFRAAGTELYDYLLAAGVRIFLYEERVLHAKVAVIDAAWMTVGSSNLDPMSLDLNLEANLFVVDEDLAGELRSSLDALMASSCKEVTARGPKKGLARRVLLLLIYYGARHMPHRGRFALRRSQAEPAL